MNELLMGQRIKALRLEKGWSQTELGNRLGVQKSVVAKYEKGLVANMKRDKIEALSKIFNVRPSYLMGFTDEPNNSIQKQLVEITSELNEEGQEKVLEYAKLLVASGEYKKHYSLAVGEE